VYKQITELEKQLNIKVDLLIICGDFQALRDQTDLDYLHCPPKYKSMGSFYKYFESQVNPPVLTVFIGGNHEAVNYMRNLYFGGWVAKNIYYLGQAGSITVSKGSTKIRISGMSGIYNHRDFQYILKP
jgi:lariat debranching enzyme